MIYLIAGEDTASSRKKISELSLGAADIVHVDGKKSALGQILDSLSANSLFSEKRTVVIEFFTKVKPQKEFFESILKFDSDANTNILLWEAADLTPTVRTKFKKAKIYEFAFPKVYYEFLDGFVPSGAEPLRGGALASKRSVELFNQVLKTFEPEQVLFGLTKRVRQLLVLKSESYSSFSELAKMQNWQLSKLKKQSTAWDESKLKAVFLQLADLDEQMKTSALTLDLGHHLDILLLSSLN